MGWSGDPSAQQLKGSAAMVQKKICAYLAQMHCHLQVSSGVQIAHVHFHPQVSSKAQIAHANPHPKVSSEAILIGFQKQ